jgi:hypothetical protein
VDPTDVMARFRTAAAFAGRWAALAAGEAAALAPSPAASARLKPTAARDREPNLRIRRGCPNLTLQVAWDPQFSAPCTRLPRRCRLHPVREVSRAQMCW